MKDEKYERPMITVISMEPDENIMGQGGTTGEQGWSSQDIPED